MPASRTLAWRRLALGFAALLVSVTAEVRADVCLGPDRLDAFLAQETAFDLQVFLSDQADDTMPVCRRQGDSLCPVRPGIYGVWSNNAAAYWVGPLIGDAEEAGYVARRLAELSERAAAINEEGTYEGAVHGRVVVRDGECFPEGGASGRAEPELLYAIGREAVAIRDAEATVAALAAEASAPSAGATSVLLSDIEETADAFAEAAFGREPGAPAAAAGGLGRMGDAIVHQIAKGASNPRPIGAGAGAPAGMSARFARWVAQVAALMLETTGIGPANRPLVEQLALVLYLDTPAPFERLAARMAPPDPEDGEDAPAIYSEAIAARYRELDALAAFAEAWAAGGPLRERAEAIAALGGQLPQSSRRALLRASTGEIFAVTEAGEASSLPALGELRRLILSGMRMPVIAGRTEDAVDDLARRGMAAAVARTGERTGVPLAPDALVPSLLAGAHVETAESVLRTMFDAAFADDPATAEHIDTLAAGGFDRFATALLANALAEPLADRAGEAGAALAPELAAHLIAAAPAQAHRRLLGAAAADWPPAWQRAMDSLIDGRTGDAADRLLRAELQRAGLAAADVEALLAGAGEAALAGRLADRLGLPEAQLADLEAGRAADYVRTRAAAALSDDGDERAALAERLADDPGGVLAEQRRVLSGELLARLDPAGEAGLRALSALAEPEPRRRLAAALLANRLAEEERSALLPAAAVAPLLEGGGTVAMEAALGPLLEGVPGGAALLAGRTEPFRDGVARALRTAVADALDGPAADELLDPEQLAALQAGRMEALGRSYAERIFAAAELDRQTVARLLAGEREAALRHEGRQRTGQFARGTAQERIARALWRAQSLVEARQLAIARQRLIHGLAVPGTNAVEAEAN